MSLTWEVEAMRGFLVDGIVTGSWDQTSEVWDATTGQELLTLKGHTGSIRSVAFRPDGNRIVTGIAGANATAQVWYAPRTLQMAE